MPLWDLYDEDHGYIVDHRCVIEAEIDLSSSYVGLKNQGATCYMNSLLQTLYHLPVFRRAVYHMPTTENGGMPLALQTLFYKLQYKGRSVGTRALTKSFGWSSYDSFLQHDVQELNRVLCEKIENKMKGTVVEGTIQKLFEGHHMNYIECIDVDYKSTRKESFCDIQLDVKGCRDVYDSFDKYVEVERMEGDNKYHAEQYGLQDAKKGVSFVDFPPVLQLQLKRFEYDYVRDSMMKINDRYEFPVKLDLDREDGKYLSPDSDRGVRNLYTLHSVLVHRGGVSGGHYYAFIKPSLSDQWFKFNDTNVTKEDGKMAVEEQYGGDDFLNVAKCSSAYMLVYIRDRDKDNIICYVDEKDIAEDLRMRLKKEKDEKEQKKKEIAEALLYTTIKVARDKDLFEQIGKDIYFDLVDHDKVQGVRVKKEISFKEFKEVVASELGVPVEFQRFWVYASRPDDTYRLRPMTSQEERKTVGELPQQNLFLEEELGSALPKTTHNDILLFVKLYDPEMRQLRYAGRIFVNPRTRPIDILSKLLEMAGVSPSEGIYVYQEVSRYCKHIDGYKTFYGSSLDDGDIVCIQTDRDGEEMRNPDVHSFFKYLRERKIVEFRSQANHEADEICLVLELSRLSTYDEVVEKLASQLGLDDPTKIQLTSPGRSSPFKYQGVRNLADMLRWPCISDMYYDSLNFEVLDIPLPDLRTVEVSFRHSTHSFTVSKKNGTYGDLILKLKEKVELSQPNADIRLFSVQDHKISEVYRSNEKIGVLYSWRNLHAEEILEEEKNLGPNDKLVPVCHLTKNPYSLIQNFGVPFMLVIHQGESLLEIKARIQKKLQVEDEEFAKWKFVCVTLWREKYLNNSDDVSGCFFEQKNTSGCYLGLEHSDNAIVVGNQNQNKKQRPLERSVKICN
ncbi:ubiquitinyl hydrolase 1 [Ranunculus cassubicifolius]